MRIFLPLFLTIFGYAILSSVETRPVGNTDASPQTPEPKENSLHLRSVGGGDEEQSQAQDGSSLKSGLSRVKRIIDGDTIEVEIGGLAQKVRLIGINTPERDQSYFEAAKNKLAELIGNKEIKLEKDISEIDKYGRLLRYIYLGDVFVNLEMVKSGYAQSSTYPPDIKFQDLFRAAEAGARQKQIGLWSPDLPKLATYEVANNKVENNAPNPNCPIKGNISSGGKIYHTPGGEYYEKTKIDEEKGERWFCSEAEAQKAGWRKSKK